jgi:hypothetical protein
MSPFHFHAKEKMQISKIFHFELSRNFFLHLQKLVFIITHQDEIIDIDNNESLKFSTYVTYTLKFTSLLRDSMFFKKTSNFWFQAFEDYFKP